MDTDLAVACPEYHYALSEQCVLTSGHPGPWHHMTRTDTDTEVGLRFRADQGVQRTQEWVPDVPGELEEGQWITWHHAVEPEPGTVVVSDLDQRAAALVADHFPTGASRTSPGDGVQDECACGSWYRTGRADLRLGREVSLLARSFFDLGFRHGPGPRPTD
jgi:hypothetical protein